MKNFLFGLLAAITFSAAGFIGGGVVSSVPVGACFDFAGTVAPSGYQIADGSALVRAGSTLYGVIGTTWGIGDGSTTFNVPNFQRRVTVGSGGSGTGTLANTVGSTGGEETHTMGAGELVAHTHSVPGLSVPSLSFSFVTGTTIGAAGQALASDGGGGGATFNGSTGTGTTGGGTTGGAGSTTAFNQLQPSAVTLKICKL